MDLVKGQAEVFPKRGKSFDPTEIPKAVKDAGFTAPEVLVTLSGTLTKRGDALELDVPGLKHPFVLTGGPQADALGKRAELRGSKIRMKGRLRPSQGNAPPGLTVEDFQAAP